VGVVITKDDPSLTCRNLALGGSDILHGLPISENDEWYGDAAIY
jgi:hypothetical protein